MRDKLTYLSVKRAYESGKERISDLEDELEINKFIHRAFTKRLKSMKPPTTFKKVKVKP